MELTEELKTLFIETAKTLKGAARRRFQAQTVKALGAGGQRLSNRLYTRLTAAEVRRQLIVQKGYQDAELPTVRTILNKLNDLGYHPSRVAKVKPKKSPRNRRHLRAHRRGERRC